MHVCLRYDPPGLFDPFRDLLFRARLSTTEAIELFDVSERTLARWRSHDSAPVMARRLAILIQSDLGSHWPDWHGWRFDGSELWTPEDCHYTNGEIRAIPYLRALADDAKRSAGRSVESNIYSIGKISV